MKTIEAFQCETCKALYQKADDAVICEKVHGTIVVSKLVYVPSKVFPDEVILTLTFPDGRSSSKSYV